MHWYGSWEIPPGPCDVTGVSSTACFACCDCNSKRHGASMAFPQSSQLSNRTVPPYKRGQRRLPLPLTPTFDLELAAPPAVSSSGPPPPRMKPQSLRATAESLTSSSCSSDAEDEAMGSSSASDSSSAHSSQSTSPIKLEPLPQPRLRGLSLNLGALEPPRIDDMQAQPLSARPTGVPRLDLRLPHSAGAAAACPAAAAPATSRFRPREPEPRQQRTGSTATLVVDLLSPAFSVPPRSDAQAQQQQCADRLGVAASSLRYYALTEVASLSDLPPNCRRVAVSVAGSSFSLEAVEELLKENRELMAAAAGATGEPASKAEQQSLKEQLAASKQIVKVAQARVAKLESALQKEQEACLGLQQEVAVLRGQLKKSEELRQRGQRALDDLKHEFEALQQELVFDGLCAQPPLPTVPAAQLHTPQVPSSLAASPMASTRTGEAHPDRLAELLGRLCENNMLEKLEQLVNRLTT